MCFHMVYVCACMHTFSWVELMFSRGTVEPCTPMLHTPYLQGNWGKLSQVPPLGARGMRIGRKTAATSRRCLTLQHVVESEPKPKKGNIHHQPQETSSPSGLAYLSSGCLAVWRDKFRLFYSQHLIPIYIIGVACFRKLGLVTQVIPVGCVKECQAHWKERSRPFPPWPFYRQGLRRAGKAQGCCTASHYSLLKQYMKAKLHILHNNI